MFNNFRGIVKSKLLGFSLLIIPCIVLFRWLSFDIFFHSDWSYLFNEWISKLSLPLWSSISNLGNVSSTAWRLPLDSLFGLFASLGFGQEVSEKFLVLFPITLFCCFSTYLFLNELIKNKLAAWTGALVFGFNTYFLAIATQGHILITAASIFGMFALWQYLKWLDTTDFKHAVLTSIFLFISGVYDFRVLYLYVIFIVLYSSYLVFFDNHDTFFQRLTKQLKSLGLVIVLIIALNIFWVALIPIIGLDPQQNVLNRSLFGNEYWNLASSVALHHPFWTGNSLSWFNLVPSPFYLFTIPIIAIVSVLAYRKKGKVVFFLLIACLGIFLSKQVDQPLNNIYPWLFSNFPGFSAFRESTKFYIFTAIAYSALIAYSVKYSSGRYKPLIIGVVSLVTVLNVIPIINGSIGSLYTPKQLPEDYKIAKGRLEASSEYYRTYWLPTYPKWFIGSTNHPAISASSSLENKPFLNLIPDETSNNVAGAKFANFSNASYARALISSSNVKYVFVPVRDIANEDDVFRSYGDDRQFYVDLLDEVPWLQKVNFSTKDLVVYENKNYKPYFSLFTSVYDVPDLNNLESVFTFANNELKQSDIQFNISESLMPNRNNLTDFFNNLKRSELQNGAISRRLTTNPGNNTVIYANSNKPVINYSLENNILTLQAQKLAGPAVQNQSSELVQSSTQTIGSVVLDLKKELYINLGVDLLKIDSQKAFRNLGTVKEAPSVFYANSQNMIVNPSLEEGLWQRNVEDCNAYDNKAKINQQLDREFKTDGEHSLVLEAINHTACTGPNEIIVKPGSEYLLSFDYKVKDGRQAGYQVDFINSSQKLFKKELYINDNDWRQELTKISIPADTKAIRVILKGYPDDRRKEQTTTYYDNLRISEISNIYTADLDTTPKYIKTTLLNSDKVDIRYQDKVLNYENLIQNPSFENGAWQEEVGDCNAYDDKPKLSMKTVDVSTDGKKSLQLEAQRHTACTNPEPINVKENSQYLLNFDYQSPNADRGGYYVAFNDPAHTAISEELPISDDTWQSFSKTLTVPYGATSMQIIVYAYPTELSNRNIINRYDNFFVTEIPSINNQYYLVGDPKIALKQPRKVEFELNSSTKKTLHIKGATTPFYLAMSEAYHPQWRLVFNNGKVKGLNSWLPTAKPDAIPDSDHIKLNDFQNGWYIDVTKYCAEEKLCTQNADGSYDLEMITEFTPQRYFYVGLIISGGTLIAVLSYLGYSFYRGRKEFKGWRYYLGNRK